MRHLKTVLLSLLFLWSIGAFALPFIGSPYAGIEGGLVINSKPEEASGHSKSDLSAQRYFIGYQPFDILAFEASYDRFQNHNKKDAFFDSKNFKLNGSEINVKLMLPCMAGLRLYGTVGAAYVKQEIDNIHIRDDKIIYTKHESQVAPTIGFGAMYFLTPHIAVHASLTHFFDHGEIKNINFIPVGIALYL